jgi:hypothetical protein
MIVMSEPSAPSATLPIGKKGRSGFPVNFQYRIILADAARRHRNNNLGQLATSVGQTHFNGGEVLSTCFICDDVARREYESVCRNHESCSQAVPSGIEANHGTREFLASFPLRNLLGCYLEDGENKKQGNGKDSSHKETPNSTVPLGSTHDRSAPLPSRE